MSHKPPAKWPGKPAPAIPSIPPPAASPSTPLGTGAPNPRPQVVFALYGPAGPIGYLTQDQLPAKDQVSRVAARRIATEADNFAAKLGGAASEALRDFAAHVRQTWDVAPDPAPPPATRGSALRDQAPARQAAHDQARNPRLKTAA